MGLTNLGAQAQNQVVTTVLFNGTSPTFTITKSNVSILLTQKGHISNLAINSSGNVSYDLHQRLDRFGSVDISYDIHGRISKIGNTEISYDIHNRIDQIGKDDIDYDLSDRVIKVGTTQITYNFTNGNLERITG